jgi:hypothetical protein
MKTIQKLQAGIPLLAAGVGLLVLGICIWSPGPVVYPMGDMIPILPAIIALTIGGVLAAIGTLWVSEYFRDTEKARGHELVGG